ncbi:hypothetical protein [Tractidigestivibacter scatoligenes]|uniref:hypothetical protein n=1 Tax=Tractidigestivibacter scatoligenes TaxID=1299998 RepID=UPI001F3462DA|nr:hypothetical protein [Tractidigestivibacter scatoligenes]
MLSIRRLEKFPLEHAVVLGCMGARYTTDAERPAQVVLRYRKGRAPSRVNQPLEVKKVQLVHADEPVVVEVLPQKAFIEASSRSAAGASVGKDRSFAQPKSLDQ